MLGLCFGELCLFGVSCGVFRCVCVDWLWVCYAWFVCVVLWVRWWGVWFAINRLCCAGIGVFGLGFDFVTFTVWVFALVL